MEGQGAEIHLLNHMIYHSLETKVSAIFRGINLGDAIFFQFFDLIGNNNTASSSENFNMSGIFLSQQIDHISECFHMSALVAGHGNPLSIFCNSGIDKFLDGSVMGEMDNLNTRILQYSPHYVSRCIVTVKE